MPVKSKSKSGSKSKSSSNNEDKKDTYYTVVNSNGSEEGRFKGNSGPATAASKAATRRFGNNSRMRITVRELGTDKTFSYMATRVKLDQPFVSTIMGKRIERNFRTDVKSIKNQ
jgi:hypothetical protein